MNKEAAESRLPGGEPVEEDEGPSSEKDCPQTENASEEAPAPLDGTKENPVLTPEPVEDIPAEAEEEATTAGCEPPVDWFEPLEDDDANSMDRNDLEEESLAGESERSESIAGSEKTMKRTYRLQIPRRKRSNRDEGWVEWPALGEGWKRKEVVRRSGSSIGQKDVYYLSPEGDRVRSRVELTTVLQGHLDLTNFEYKTGKFYEGEAPPIRIRGRGKRKPRERSSSESSWLERGEGAETPDSHHRLTPNITSKNLSYNQMSVSLNSSVGNPKQSSRSEDLSGEEKIKLPLPSSSRPLPSINGEIGSEDSILVCAKCGISFTGTWYDKQRKRPCCPTCWASKTKEHPMIRFRKWIPCGQCVGCHNTVNCGQCANCKHGLQSPESRKRICRKRRCICPIRKSPGSGAFMHQRPHNDIHEAFDDNFGFQSEVKDSQRTSLKSSDAENFSVNVDLEEDDLSTDDDDDWHKKRKRRSCGECKACLCRKDCGTCDFCIDKPKFGGSNKKRQKCRLRQCQRQAMRHLLPFQMGLSEYGSDGPVLPGRPRPHYTYSRKSSLKKHKGLQSGLDFTDNEDEDSNLQPIIMDMFSFSLYLEITQIYSLADNPSGSGVDMDNQLMKLLHSLRSSVLPILWYAIMVEGPQLQLIQCSKQSAMADTIVLIDPGFCYQVTVQKQPLLPTHSLYDRYPARLTSVTEVVSLLLGLEKYVVCHGIPLREPLLYKGSLVLERASTCDFLVKKSESACFNCRALQGR
ncbi:methyl-CpG-binding domain protein 1b [Xenentodon cancila]